jgi:hypothetical protein
MTNKNEKQQLLIEYLIASPDTFTLCNSIIKSDYFDPEFRKTVNFVQEYYDQYHATPNTDQIFAEVGVKLKTQIVTKDQIAYCSNEIERFCKRRAFEQALVTAPSVITDANYGKALQALKDAISISLNKDMGIDYFTDPLLRLQKMALDPPRTPTKWHQFDNLLDGGIERTEMLLFSANSGGGKSIALTNLAINFLAQKLNVLYITMEISEKMVSQRFDAMLSGIPTAEGRYHVSTIADSLEIIAPHMGRLVVKHMPSQTTSNTIRSYLKEFELKYSCVPDLLIVDYLDVMGSNVRVVDNLSEKDKQTSEELHDIGFDYNMFIATASQQNRGALEAQELNQGHIAGGLTKVNTVDIYVSIVLNASMRSSGEIGFVFLKTRSSNGVGKQIYLKWDNKKSLRIMNHMEDETIDSDGVITDRVAQSKLPQTKKNLADFDFD